MPRATFLKLSNMFFNKIYIYKCSLDEGRKDTVNLNCSENDQQWQGEGFGGRMEAWWASRGGSSDERNSREGREGARMNES